MCVDLCCVRYIRKTSFSSSTSSEAEVKKSKSVSKLNADQNLARRVAQAEQKPLKAWVAEEAWNSLQGVLEQLLNVDDELNQLGINKKPKLISKSFGFVTWEH